MERPHLRNGEHVVKRLIAINGCMYWVHIVHSKKVDSNLHNGAYHSGAYRIRYKVMK